MADGQLSTVLRHIRHLVAGREEDERTDGQLLDAFLDRRDEAAFANLVRRHGPMVLGVCRRVLADAHAAEDAFQATFLVLFRRARALDHRSSVAGWLYTVAYHAALRARAGIARRQRHERQALPMPPTPPSTDAQWNDLRRVLDEELNALPEKYRQPVLLCYVEGKTNTEAARLLGCPIGTVKGRLSRARELLRQRLTRRGITVTGALLSAALGEHAAAVMPNLLLENTVQTVVMASGNVALTTPASKLAASVLRGMAASRIQVVTVMLLGLAVLGLGGGIWARRTVQPTQDTANASALLAPSKEQRPTQALKPVDLSRPMAVRGRVVGPDGKPVAHAQVAILIDPRLPTRGGDFTAAEPETLSELSAGPDGRFHWKGIRPPLGAYSKAFLVAKAKGFGLALAHLSPNGSAAEQIVQLAPERIAHGRLVDLQGHPAGGVRLRFDGCWRAGKGGEDGITSMHHPHLPSFWPAGPVVTDRDGRFALRGFDDRQSVGAMVRDLRFACQPITIPAGPLPREVTKVLVPGQTIEGTVVTADTGKAVPHARLTIYANDQEAAYSGTGMCAVADAKGHFSINPWRGRFYGIAAFPADGTPYLSLVKTMTWPKGAVKQTVEMRLPRGVLLRGKVIEAGSGRPIPRASVQYWPRDDNKSPLRDQTLMRWLGAGISGPDGSFAMAVLPGPGTLLISGPTLDFVHREIDENRLSNGNPGGQRYYPDAALPLDLQADVQSKPVVVTLKRGVTVHGSLVGPDGNPVSEALLVWRHSVPAYLPVLRASSRVIGASFELQGLDPDKAETVYFLEPKKRWGATIHVSGKQATGPLRVQLQPCGQATVRYVNQHGKRLVHRQVSLEMIITPGAWDRDREALLGGKVVADAALLGNIDRQNYWHERLTAKDGRCTLPALIPDCLYRLPRRIRKDNRYHAADACEFRVQAGQTLDLGEVVVEE